MNHQSVTIIITSVIAVLSISQSLPKQISIEQGTLRGKLSANGKFTEYVGIPYATTNASFRFQPPLSAPTWDGIFDATDDTTICPQITKTQSRKSNEDCLKINVYVPNTSIKKPLAVMVYIHGGAFTWGDGGKNLLGPEFLVKHNVIVVTFNYRVGLFGFLCLGIKEAPGNAGLRDQIAALKWVKKNIAKFGGDPNNVTLFGESAGAVSVSLLLASHVTHDLFNKVIMESGSSLTHWSLNRQPLWSARYFAAKTGKSLTKPIDLYNYFSEMSVKEIVEANFTRPLSLYNDKRFLFSPCVEKPIPGIETVLSDLPYKLLKTMSKNIPVIHGTNSNEGLFWINDESPEALEYRNKNYLFASDLIFNSKEEADQIAKNIKEFYFGHEKISVQNKMIMVDFITHYHYEVPASLESEILVSQNTAPVFNYYFDYSGGRNIMKQRSGFGNETGAAHVDELFYLFNGTMAGPGKISDGDKTVIQRMTKLWTNFAKFSNPTPCFDVDLPVKWIPSSKTNQNFLIIRNEMKMSPTPNPQVFSFWKSIYARYRLTNKYLVI